MAVSFVSLREDSFTVEGAILSSVEAVAIAVTVKAIPDQVMLELGSRLIWGPKPLDIMRSAAMQRTELNSRTTRMLSLLSGLCPYSTPIHQQPACPEQLRYSQVSYPVEKVGAAEAFLWPFSPGMAVTHSPPSDSPEARRSLLESTKQKTTVPKRSAVPPGIRKERR